MLHPRAQRKWLPPQALRTTSQGGRRKTCGETYHAVTAPSPYGGEREKNRDQNDPLIVAGVLGLIQPTMPGRVLSLEGAPPMSVRQLALCAPSIVAAPALLQRVLDKYPNAKIWRGTKITDEDVLIDFLRGCDAAIIAFEPITDRVLAALPELKVVAKMAAGCESIDFDAMKKHGVRFGYTFGVNKLSVAELTLSFMISGLRFIPEQNQSMRAGERPGIKVGRLLTGRTIGLHGCGNIGREVVRLLAPFNAEILACDVKDYARFYAANRVTPVDIVNRRVNRPVSAGQAPGALRFNPVSADEKPNLLLVVKQGSGDLAVIRTRTDSLVTIIPVGEHPQDLAVKLF